MKSLTGFIKVLIRAQKLHCRTTVSEECLLMTASTLKYDHNSIIIKRAESLKLFWYQEVAERWLDIKIC